MKKIKLDRVLFALLLCACFPQPAIAQALLGDLESGHWVVVKGSYDAKENRFLAEKITVTEPDDDAALIGDITENSDGTLRLLGFELEPEKQLSYRDVDPDQLNRVRVKAKGEWLGGKRFEVESFSARGSGRERLEGPVIVSTVEETASYSVLGIPLAGLRQVELTADSRRPLASYGRSIPAPTGRSDIAVDDDDEFGDGIKLGRDLILTHRLTLQSSREDNFNFDHEDNEDRQDIEAGLRSRLDWRPGSRFSATAELRINQSHREQQDRSSRDRTDSRLGETWFRTQLNERAAVTLGRQDFDDPREWLFDTNLDAVRYTHQGRRLNLDASISKRIDGDGSRDEDASNFILYLSNADDDRHVGGYLIRRKFDRSSFDESTLHVGGRLLGEWLPDSRVWIEGAHQSGRRQRRDVDAWAIDVGMTWFPVPKEALYLTAGMAYATGDDPSTDRDETFRQTGLQDNNGKLGGITSFKYYGELSDPELSNMSIATLGVGSRPLRDLSIDLLGHAYRLNEPAVEVADAEWDADLTGSGRFLGWEADLVVGLRGRERWSIEAVLGYFEPGKAFEDRDSSYFGKLQLRVSL